MNPALLILLPFLVGLLLIVLWIVRAARKEQRIPPIPPSTPVPYQEDLPTK